MTFGINRKNVFYVLVSQEGKQIADAFSDVNKKFLNMFT
jgi:hypothetical protein